MVDKTETTKETHAFRRGNEVIWRKTVEAYSCWLYGLSIRLLWNSNDAEEAVQECFLRAFRQRRQLKDFERLHSWLRKICIRVCLRNRWKKREVSLHEAEEFLVLPDRFSPDRSAITRENAETVLQALAKLSPRQRGCLILTVFEELSMKEIADSMGIKEGTVKRYIFEARQFLYQYLKIDRRNDEK